MTDYKLDDQIGFVLRRVNQRHLAIFSQLLPELTPTQFAALAKLIEVVEVSQNELGRLIAMDAATIKGVVDRLARRGLLEARRNPNDSRRKLLRASSEGKVLYENVVATALRISEKTMDPLSTGEKVQFLGLLKRLW
ncbi:MAG: MarR family transcriptional regulator [Rhodobacteraceae bacterium]|nr:MarR family transcriptional regulator [Paracoccaceae bacterium]